jgi:hypothetical protein
MKIDRSVRDLFISFSSISSIAAISRHKVGENMDEHRDHWIKDADFIVEYGIVVYYNDNYDGGEINYPELGISIKPKAGSLVLHSGDILHGTLPVKNGDTRYFSTAFVKSTKEIPLVLNQTIFGENNGI